jgi:hypothetical protein
LVETIKLKNQEQAISQVGSGPKTRLIQKHIALPTDHGSWVFLLSPLIIGLATARAWNPASLWVVLAAFSAFLIRQPLIIVVKVLSKRRPRRDLAPARFWLAIYGLLGLLALAGTIWSGYSYILWLAIPGIPVFAWHLYLVSKRSERRQIGIELVATGVLALCAPAAYWVGTRSTSSIGWLLFLACWLQSAASIVYAYLRLEQRELKEVPDFSHKLKMGARSLAYTTFNLVFILVLIAFRLFPPLIALAFLIQWLENIYGLLVPAIGVKPTRIGFRQLFISAVFTISFILFWAW